MDLLPHGAPASAPHQGAHCCMMMYLLGGCVPPSPLPPPLSRSFPQGPHATWLDAGRDGSHACPSPRTDGHLPIRHSAWTGITDQRQQHQIHIALTPGPGARLALSRRHDSETAKTQKNGNAQRGGRWFTGQVFFRRYNSCYRSACPSSNCRCPCNSVRGNADTRGRTAENSLQLLHTQSRTGYGTRRAAAGRTQGAPAPELSSISSQQQWSIKPSTGLLGSRGLCVTAQIKCLRGPSRRHLALASGLPHMLFLAPLPWSFSSLSLSPGKDLP